MILGIGSDLTDIRRIELTLKRFGKRFEERVFTPAERALAGSRKEKAATLAKRFAAKEACLKALGTGLRHGIAWHDVEIIQATDKKPEIALHNQAAATLKTLTPAAKRARIHLTLTDEYPYALALVIIEAIPL